MILKNESNIILRLLESVLPIIDSYCICDTRSSDNTIESIKTFFKDKNINGKFFIYYLEILVRIIVLLYPLAMTLKIQITYYF